MHYDLAIVGAGWAGFNAALKARELGLKVCLIEKGELGGACLNSGCIPTKTLIQSAKVFTLCKKSGIFGIDTQDPFINFSKIQERKNRIIQQLRQGLQFMLKGIDIFNGKACILSNDKIKVEDQVIQVKFIVLACGSMPSELNALRFDGKKVLSSADLLNLGKIPKNLLIIGGGVIGCEFASLFSIFGVKVSIVEMMPDILPGVDKEVAKKLETIYRKKSVKVNTSADALAMDLTSYDLVLVCVGRTADTQELGLKELGLDLEKSSIIVDEYLRTNIPNIYAAGDCTGKICLAHFAAYQGSVAAKNIADPLNLKRPDAAAIPGCIFTDPEIAFVGLSEDDARSKNMDITISKFDFLGSGMARILDETEGFIKVISDRKTTQVLGASIIGPKATELIAVLTLAVSNRLSLSQVKDTIFAHPTLSESIGQV